MMAYIQNDEFGWVVVEGWTRALVVEDWRMSCRGVMLVLLRGQELECA